ncbi:pentapeptide repeat-containing protein [Lentzea sp. NPDC004789]
MSTILPWLERVFAAYWPPALAGLVLFWAYRLGRRALAIWAGHDVDFPDSKPSQEAEPGVKGSMAWAVIKWLTLAIVLAGTTGYGLFLVLGSPSLPDRNTFTTSELLDLMKIGLAVVGGLGAVVALAVAYRKQQVSEAAHLMATGQELREQTKFFNERYVSAAEQLGHERFAVRLAGVYAMVGLADDWPAGRQTCVDVLCGYLRTPYPEGDPTDREVRQEIIKTLLDHVWDHEIGERPVRMDFRKVQFEDLDLSRRKFSAEMDFEKAVFHGKLTNFSECLFTGVVNFYGATFKSEKTSFADSNFRDGTVNFRRATFSGKLVDFADAVFLKSDLSFAEATVADGTKVSFEGTRMQASSISLENVALRNAELDFSLMLFMPSTAYRAKSGLNLRKMLANNTSVTFKGSKINDAVLSLGHARLVDCTIDLEDLELIDTDLLTQGMQPVGAAAALRRLGGAMQKAPAPEHEGLRQDEPQ